MTTISNDYVPCHLYNNNNIIQIFRSWKNLYCSDLEMHWLTLENLFLECTVLTLQIKKWVEHRKTLFSLRSRAGLPFGLLNGQIENSLKCLYPEIKFIWFVSMFVKLFYIKMLNNNIFWENTPILCFLCTFIQPWLRDIK